MLLSNEIKEEELCPPPVNKARANRMSAEGISVFYGAKDAATAFAEIFTGEHQYATIATFVNLRELYILDLADKTKYSVPSLFDTECQDLRETKIFLNELNQDLTRDIKDMKNIEYVPAQVVAEYFRFLYDYNGRRIDGIAYNSSKNKDGGVCYVLFFNQEQCLEDKRVKQELKLCSSKRYNTIEVIVKGLCNDQL